MFYQLEAEHLGDLLRIRVRSGTGATLRLPPIFTGLSLRTGRRESRAALRVQHPYLPANRFQGVRPSQRKENSSRDSDWRLDGRFRCRSVIPRGPAAGRSPIPGSGILTGFPFAEKARGLPVIVLGPYSATFQAGFPCGLAPTNPRSTAVRVEPFSASVFKALV